MSRHSFKYLSMVDTFHHNGRRSDITKKKLTTPGDFYQNPLPDTPGSAPPIEGVENGSALARELHSLSFPTFALHLYPHGSKLFHY